MTSKQDIITFLKSKPGYIKYGSYKLSNLLDADQELCEEALREVRREYRLLPGKNKKKFKIKLEKDFTSHQNIFREAFKTEEVEKIVTVEVKQQKNGKNVLIIGDLHEPFCLKGYLEHCLEIYRKYKCNEVVFIGDIIDNHASSYHETNPDGYNAGEELKLAIQRIKQWYEAFPKASIIIGNHDRLIMRKAQTSGLSKMWIKDYADVLGTPGWKFVESVTIDNVLYIHGEGGTARSRMAMDLQSVVQGHLHTQCYTEWLVGAKFKIFGMQVGCGIDHDSYAMAYAKAGKKPAIACGVVLQGETAINCLMNL